MATFNQSSQVSPYHESVQQHYESHPYPSYPWYSIGQWKALEPVDVSKWGASRPVDDVWLVGSGTIAPLMFGRRNYSKRILATDLSARSLAIASRRLRLMGIRNVKLEVGDLLHSSYTQTFDAIDCYGVLHHLVSPEMGLKNLARALRQGGILRLMVYSREARAPIESLRAQVVDKKLKSLREVKEFLKQTPSAFRVGDLANDSGIADALLNPVVHTFDHEAFEKLLASEPSLRMRRFDSTSNFVALLERI